MDRSWRSLRVGRPARAVVAAALVVATVAAAAAVPGALSSGAGRVGPSADREVGFHAHAVPVGQQVVARTYRASRFLRFAKVVAPPPVARPRVEAMAVPLGGWSRQLDDRATSGGVSSRAPPV